MPAPVAACEQQVFARWYGNTAESLAEAYDPYRRQSMVGAVQTVDGEVLGFFRLIGPGQLLPRTLVDLAGPPWQVDPYQSAATAGLDLANTWDIATIGATTTRRDVVARVSWLLLYVIARTIQVNDGQALTAVIDHRAKGLLGPPGQIMRP